MSQGAASSQAGADHQHQASDVCTTCNHTWEWHTKAFAHKVYGKRANLGDHADGEKCYYDHPAIKFPCNCTGFRA